MHLAEDKLTLAHDLISKLYSRPFNEELVHDVAQDTCALIDAHYFALLLFSRERRSLPIMIDNNPPGFRAVYYSVIQQDFIMESLVSSGKECVLSRMPESSQPINRSFIRAVRDSRPSSDGVYVPIKPKGLLQGFWALARAGLHSPYYTENELLLFRFVTSFMSDAFERSLLPPPEEANLAYLDHRGAILSAGPGIQEAFDTLFGRTLIGEAGTSGRLKKLFRDRCQAFLSGPLKVGMDKLELSAKGMRYLFSFGVLKGGIYLPNETGVPCATVRLLQALPSPVAARPKEGSTLATQFEFTKREAEVIEGIYRGRSNKEIAFGLGIEESTVKRYTHNIFEKTGFRSRVELVLGIHGA
jgi:DNA-binding CsgD family transcriptional regulator